MALRAALVDEEVIARRERLGIDHRDEVWDGIYVMTPPPRLPHQELTFLIATALRRLGLSQVNVGIGVGQDSDYRVPDVAVYDGVEVDERSLYVDRARLVVEVISPGEDPHAKLGFYAKRAGEVLLVRADGVELLVGAEPVGPEPVDGWLVGRAVAVRLDDGGDLLLALPDRSQVERVPRP